MTSKSCFIFEGRPSFFYYLVLEKLKRTIKNQTGVYISFNTNYSRILRKRPYLIFMKRSSY